MQGQSNCQNTEGTSATPLYLYMETIFFILQGKHYVKSIKYNVMLETGITVSQLQPRGIS